MFHLILSPNNAIDSFIFTMSSNQTRINLI